MKGAFKSRAKGAFLGNEHHAGAVTGSRSPPSCVTNHWINLSRPLQFGARRSLSKNSPRPIAQRFGHILMDDDGRPTWALAAWPAKLNAVTVAENSSWHPSRGSCHG